MTGRRALVAAYTAPEPDRDSGSRRLDDHIRMLQAAGWHVTFLATRPATDRRAAAALERRGVPVVSLDLRGVEDLLSAVAFDLALLAFWPTGELLLPVLRRTSPWTRVVVDSVDLHLLRHARRTLADGANGGVLGTAWGEAAAAELTVYAAADRVLTVSAKEASLIDDLLGESGHARAVPDSEPVPRTVRPLADRRGVLFVGSFRHPPNADAVAFLCRHVLPLVPADLLARHPVSIVGDGLGDDVRALGDGQPAVRMIGWVPTLGPWLAAARVGVLPLRSGAGTKRKLLTTLVHGTPAVSTRVGVEGVALEPGRDVLVADDAAGFAAAIVTLLTDDERWEALARSGRERIVAGHGPDVARAALAAVIAEVIAQPPRGPLLPDVNEAHHHARLVAAWEQGRHIAGRAARPARPGTASASTTASDRADPLTPARATADILAVDGPAADPPTDDPVRLIAFYLPQFHPIPENDRWWGEGFTEWTNVRRATPLFPGHRQPRAPGELGAYDLRDPGVRQRQADLAREHGIHGFCYYRYWFDGKRLLERPFEEVLASGSPDLPFALCWANEAWSRRWDGSEQEVLQAQGYSAQDDLAHIRALLPALADPRAIRVGGRPLLLIYQGWALPEPRRLTDTWRSEVARAGLPDLHLLTVETGWDAGWDPTPGGFDGKVRFQPQFSRLAGIGRLSVPEHPELAVHDYRAAWPVLATEDPRPYRTYATVFPGWDNTPRRGGRGVVVDGATPDLYERWLRVEIERARTLPPGERLVFLNAWNEWAEGAYLEPDATWGRGYLEATRRASGMAVAVPGPAA